MVAPKLEFEKFLGQGSYGSVSLFKYTEPRTTCQYTAAKTSDKENALSLYKEFHILSRFKGCSRIVQCAEDEVLENDDGEGNIEYMMLLEYAPGGSLKDFMDKFQNGKLPETLIIDFTRMILDGLGMIHKQGFVHCDLKPDNILVFPKRVYKKGEWRWTYELKISDFGLARRDGDSKWWSLRHRFAGTPIYMSPESVSHGETKRGLDLWSLGCIVLEMFTGKTPWWHEEYYYLKHLMMCYGPPIPSDLPYDAKCFLMTCFAPKPDERKDALTLLRHNFLNNEVRETLDVKAQNLMLLGMKLEKLNRRFGKVLLV